MISVGSVISFFVGVAIGGFLATMLAVEYWAHRTKIRQMELEFAERRRIAEQQLWLDARISERES